MATTSDTIVLITGANKGVGRATAQRLAREHGFTVIIGSRNLSAGEKVATEPTSEGHRAFAVQLDVLSDESIAAAAKFVDETFGRLDVLINNHGQFIDRWEPSIPELSTRDLYTKTLATNVVGTACVTEAFLPLLKKAQQPRIVFVSSSMSSLANALDKKQLYYPLNGAAYITSKTAVNMLALQYAKRLEDVGGKVNAACPGLVDTDLTRKAYGAAAKTPEQGAEYIVKLATDAEEVRGRNGTFGSSEGDYPW